MTLDELIADGWRRHADEPRRVHDELAEAVGLVTDSEKLHSISRLITHLNAEHLDDRRAGIALLDALRIRLEAEASDAYRPASTGIATLRFLDGDSGAMERLSREERAHGLATAAAALAWHEHLASAVAAYKRALEEASAGLPDGSPALRALAASGNNIAVSLENKVDRDDDEADTMIQIADAALGYWKRVGGWLQEERALYRCAQSRLLADRAPEAIEYAQRCLQVCEQNNAPAFERFFAYAVGALAYRAADQRTEFERWRTLCQESYSELSPEDRASCEEDLVELGVSSHESVS